MSGFNWTGDQIEVYYRDGTDDTPISNNEFPRSSFSGFRIAPAVTKHDGKVQFFFQKSDVKLQKILLCKQ